MLKAGETEARAKITLPPMSAQHHWRRNASIGALFGLAVAPMRVFWKKGRTTGFSAARRFL
jgi:hypothetical protein